PDRPSWPDTFRRIPVCLSRLSVPYSPSSMIFSGSLVLSDLEFYPSFLPNHFQDICPGCMPIFQARCLKIEPLLKSVKSLFSEVKLISKHQARHGKHCI